MQAAKFDIHCPPWALPQEEVPIQVRIEKTVTEALGEVVFELDESLRLADTINVLERKESNGRLAVKTIDTARRSEYDYFGIVVATREPFKDLRKEVPVKASFSMKDGSVDTFVAPVRIFRPRLEFADAPDALALADADAGKQSLPIGLRFSGFGDIVIRAKCTMGKSVVSRRTSFLDEILERLLRDPILHPDAEMPDLPDAAVDPSAALPITEELKKKLLSENSIRSMLNAGKISMDAAGTLRRLAGSDKERLMDHVRKTMPDIIVDMLSDIRDRTLGENLQLESKTAIVVPAELPASELVVEFRYADVLGNEYDPIRKAVQIDDRRRAKTGASMEVPLAVTADESEAYMNVGEMAIGSSD